MAIHCQTIPWSLCCIWHFCLLLSKSQHPKWHCTCDSLTEIQMSSVGQLEVAVARSEHWTTTILLLKEFYQKWYFFGCCRMCLFFHHWGWCHWLCQSTRFAACPAIITHLTHGACATTALFFWLLFASCCCCLPAWLSRLAWHSLHKWLASLPCRWQSLKPLSLHPGVLFFVVVLVVALTTVVAELLLLALAMLMVMIIAIVGLSVWPVAPALVGKMLQFAFVVQALWQLTSLQQ